MDTAWNKWLSILWYHDIITVVAAGNDGDTGHGLHESVPQALGRADNPLITVGAVDINGQLMDFTTSDQGLGGSMTAYSYGDFAVAAGLNSDGTWRSRGKTSAASAATAGLAAYFGALDTFNRDFIKGSVSQSMKDYIAKYAYVRSRTPTSNIGTGYRSIPAADSIKVIYNGALDGICAWPASLPRRDLHLRSQNVTSNSTGDSGDIDFNGSMIQSFCSSATSEIAAAMASSTLLSLSARTSSHALSRATSASSSTSLQRSIASSTSDTTPTTTYSFASKIPLPSKITTTSTTSTTPIPTPTPPPVTSSDTCVDYWNIFDDEYEMHGRNFDSNKLGDYGSNLLSELRGCGVVTDWKFGYELGSDHTDTTVNWWSTGDLPVGQKTCIGHALVSVGGTADSCTGAG